MKPSPQDLATEHPAPNALDSSRHPLSSRELPVGSTLRDGRFELRAALGRGGMGVVYEAFDHTLQTTVALKTLYLSKTESLERLKREFRSMSDVAHPNLVALLGLYQDARDNGLCYFTMDKVEGTPFPAPRRSVDSDAGAQGELTTPAVIDSPSQRTLPMVSLRLPTTRNLQRKPVGAGQTYSTADIRSALHQLLSGVLAIHQAGKVHRDIKPSNVLRSNAGKVVILDYGLVDDRVPEGIRNDPNNDLERVSGTPSHMAPEQAAGKPPDPKNDCYAVGVILYETLTGCLPHSGPSSTVMHDKQCTDPPSPKQLDPAVDPLLSSICMGLLTRDPARRPGALTALQMLGEGPPASQSIPWISSDGLFLGRASLIAQLENAANAVTRNDRPCVAEVYGASGMGKSTLLSRFCSELKTSSHLCLLRGRCYEREDLPHKGVDQILSDLSDVLSQPSFQATTRQVLNTPEYRALRTLVPRLPPRSRAPEQAGTRDRPGNAPAEPRALRKLALQALQKVMFHIAQARLLVVVVDDLQWAGQDGIRLLLSVLAGPHPPPMLLIVGYRPQPENSTGPVAYFHNRLRAMLSSLNSTKLEVTPLSPVDSRIFASQLLERVGVDSSGPVLDSLCREGEGSPLVLEELARSVTVGTAQVSGALSLKELLDTRLRRLPPASRRYFDMLCVAGRPIAPGLLAVASQESVGRTAEGQGAANQQAAGILRALKEARLCRPGRNQGQDTVDVFHDSLRERGLASLSITRLAECHRSLACAYETETRHNRERDAERLAVHLEGAGLREAAAQYAAIAAEQAATSFAFDRAAELYRTSLRLFAKSDPKRSASLFVQLADTLSNGGRGAEAAPLYMAASKDAAPETRVQMQQKAAEQWLVSGHIDKGLSALRDVLRQVGLHLPHGSRRALLSLLTARAKLRIRGLRFTERSEVDIPTSTLLRIDACKAAWALSFVNTLQGSAFQAQFLNLALSAGEPRRIAVGLAMEAAFRSTQGGSAEGQVRALRREQEKLATRLNQPIVTAFSHLSEGQSSYMLGRWAQCSRALQKAEVILEGQCQSVAWELNSSRFFWGNSIILRGQWIELRSRLDAWRQDADERNDRYAAAGFILIASRSLTLADDAPDRAHGEIDEALKIWKTPATLGVHELLAALSRMQVCLYQNQPQRAAETLEALLPQFSRSLMTRVQLARIQVYQHAAYCHLAQLEASGAGAGSRLFKETAKYQSLLDAEQMPWADAFSQYIRAALSHLKGNRENTIIALGRASTAFEGSDMNFYAAATRHRQGTILGGERGRSAMRQAETLFSQQDVRSPAQVIAMMSPGFGPPT